MVSALQMSATQEPIRAAEYLRKSTEHQKYSIENQADALRAYAARRGIQIVRTYADEKSGVLFDQRPGLRQLIEDVLTGRADFKAILVYDVTRWGRFLDPDESAYYEFICKRASIKVHYCAEQFENFENDASSIVAILKNAKRVMAGDFSRDLSVKTFAGHVRLFKLGFRQGAAPPFGLRRLLIDQSGNSKFLLGRGEHKSIQTDRVVLVPGPPEEIKTVRWIFSLFVKRKKTEKQVVRLLNARGVSSGLGRPWTYRRVRRLLRSEVYTGTDVWNRMSASLGKKTVYNPPETWLRSKCGFKSLIDPALFARAQTIIQKRRLHLTDEEKLNSIRGLFRKHGFLNKELIDDAPGVPSTASYARWFGGLREVYRRVGFQDRMCPLSDEQLLEKLRWLLKKKGNISEKLMDETAGVPNSSTYRYRFGRLSNAYRLIGFKARPNSIRAKSEATKARSDEELLVSLSELLRARDRLSARIIAKSKRVPSAPTYARRFGSLPRAYELIGYSRQRSGQPGNR